MDSGRGRREADASIAGVQDPCGGRPLHAGALFRPSNRFAPRLAEAEPSGDGGTPLSDGIFSAGRNPGECSQAGSLSRRAQRRDLLRLARSRPRALPGALESGRVLMTMLLEPYRVLDATGPLGL